MIFVRAAFLKLIAYSTLVSLVLVCSTAQAGVIFDVDDTVTLGNTGSFDLFIDLTGTGPDSATSPPTVTAFSVDLLVLSTTGTLLPGDITLGPAGQPINHGALFGPGNLSSTPATVGDLQSANFVLLANAVVVSDLIGLVNVPFSVTPGKIGTFTIGYESMFTELGRSTGGAVPITLGTGIQTVGVPEPSTIALAVVALIGLAGLRMRTRRCAVASRFC